MKLERDEVVRTAVRLLEEVGLDGLSMRRLAKELDVQAPALYWHFANKQELLDHMLVAMAGGIGHRPDPGQPWDEWLLEHSRRQRRSMLAHRDSARLASGTRPTRELLPLVDGMVGTLREAGIPAVDAQLMILTLSQFVIGSVLEEQGTDREVTELDVTGLPNMAAALADFPGPEGVFEFGLRALVAGFRAQVAERSADPAGA